MEGIPSSNEEVTTQMALFANWVRSGYMYPNDVIPPSDAIAQTVLFVIDQLPVSLDLSFAKENRFRNDRYPMKLPLTARRLFQSLLSMLQTPKPGSGRFVWVVDTVDEGIGPSNAAIYNGPKGDCIFAADREAAKAAVYFVEAE